MTSLKTYFSTWREDISETSSPSGAAGQAMKNNGRLIKLCFLPTFAFSGYLHYAKKVTPEVENPLAYTANIRDVGSIPGLGRSPGEGHVNPLQLFLPGEPHGQRSLVDYSPWGRKESDTTEKTKPIYSELLNPCLTSYSKSHL